MAPAPILTLNTGAKFPSLGFGTYCADKSLTYTATLHALKSGWRHIDTAWGYQNEEQVGKAVKDSGVPRSEIFLTTKIVDHLHAPEDVEWCLNDSLKKLGMDYVDLALVHWPIATEKESQQEHKKDKDGKAIVNQELTSNPRPTWEAMEKLYDSGKARAIGVSNWTIKGLESLLSYARVPPAVNQVELHPLLPNTALLNYCNSKKIILSAYSPLGGQGSDNPLFNNDNLQDVAKKYGHSIVQILIAWGLKRGYAVLPKSFTPERIESNLEVVELSDEEFKAVEEAVGGKIKRTCPYWGNKDVDVWAESE